ncbi:hypothetical protein BJX61DRAFT_527902 [Aspergillus egyptiacus]|nr:hypothetical protein BJX61DRAFT_527902 [Aspergillus egyptiacus]
MSPFWIPGVGTHHVPFSLILDILIIIIIIPRISVSSSYWPFLFFFVLTTRYPPSPPSTFCLLFVPWRTQLPHIRGPCSPPCCAIRSTGSVPLVSTESRSSCS